MHEAEDLHQRQTTQNLRCLHDRYDLLEAGEVSTFGVDHLGFSCAIKPMEKVEGAQA